MSDKRIQIGPVERRGARIEARSVDRNSIVDRKNLTAYVFESEPLQLTDDLLERFIRAGVEIGASDLSIGSGQIPRLEIDGVLYNATRKAWNTSDVDMAMAKITGALNMRAEINAMKQLDFSYEIPMAGGQKQRFRVNITGCLGDTEHGIEISMRTLPMKTPTKADVGLADDEVAAMMPRDGLVILAGGTGHGKSTSMAAVIREHLISRERPVKIVDFQAPIEYTFRDVIKENEGSSSLIYQSEVGKHIRNFEDGVRASLRRKPNIICVGESRDAETISASIEASLTGHLVYTTAHADSVAGTVQRLLSRFVGADREARANDLASTLRFIMVQALVPRIDQGGKGRIAVREYLRISERIRENLASTETRDWPLMLMREVNQGSPDAGPDDLRRSMRDAATDLADRGIISRTMAMLLSRSALKLEDGLKQIDETSD